MKKRYILTFLIPLVLAAVIALIITPNAESTLVTKLANFEKSEAVFYEVNITAEGRDLGNINQKIAEYKAGENYYSQYYQNENTPLIVNMSSAGVKFGTNGAAANVPLEQFKNWNSLYLFDKLSVSDIKKKSVKRNKEVSTDSYFAELNNGGKIEITFDGKNISSIKYDNASYMPQIAPLGSGADIIRGSVTVIYSNYKTKTSPSEEYRFSKNTINISYDELVKSIANDSFEYDGAEEVFSGLKSALQITTDESAVEDSIKETEEEEQSSEVEDIREGEMTSIEEMRRREQKRFEELNNMINNAPKSISDLKENEAEDIEEFTDVGDIDDSQIHPEDLENLK